MFRRGRSLIGAGLVGILMSAAPVTAGASEDVAGKDLARLAEKGEGIFQQKCSACHTIGGGDRPMGPDLAGVTQRRQRLWLTRFIREPDRVIAEGDQVALQLLKRFNDLEMPNQGLSGEEAEALIAFLTLPSEEEHWEGEMAAAPLPLVGGDIRRGEALFVGSISFAKGGAPCLACHGIAGRGPAGGANYGPDLTAMFEDYGPEGVSSILESLPFPSMEPIYARRPLIVDERADLMAFLQEVSEQPPAKIGGRLVRDVTVGVVLLLGVFLFFGGRRLKGVRRPLIEKAREQRGEMQ